MKVEHLQSVCWTGTDLCCLCSDPMIPFCHHSFSEVLGDKTWLSDCYRGPQEELEVREAQHPLVPFYDFLNQTLKQEVVFRCSVAQQYNECTWTAAILETPVSSCLHSSEPGASYSNEPKSSCWTVTVSTRPLLQLPTRQRSDLFQCLRHRGSRIQHFINTRSSLSDTQRHSWKLNVSQRLTKKTTPHGIRTESTVVVLVWTPACAVKCALSDPLALPWLKKRRD